MIGELNETLHRLWLKPKVTQEWADEAEIELSFVALKPSDPNKEGHPSAGFGPLLSKRFIRRSTLRTKERSRSEYFN
jgi:hypothetical protein